MVAVSDFSRLAISSSAFAKAAAIMPIDSLARCIAGPHNGLHELETDGAGFRAFGAYAMPDSFLGVVRHQGFEFALGLLMLEKRRSGPPEAAGKFRPSVGSTHIDDPHGLDPRPRRLGPEEVRRLAGLHAAPELLFGRQQQVLIER